MYHTVQKNIETDHAEQCKTTKINYVQTKLKHVFKKLRKGKKWVCRPASDLRTRFGESCGTISNPAPHTASQVRRRLRRTRLLQEMATTRTHLARAPCETIRLINGNRPAAASRARNDDGDVLKDLGTSPFRPTNERTNTPAVVNKHVRFCVVTRSVLSGN